MARIHIVTDSGSDLPEHVRKELGISVVPLSIQFGDDILRDGVDIQVDEFYRRLTSGSDLPSTCQPSPADFVKLYEEIAEPGDKIVSVHLSSKLSGTYQSAVLAARMLENLEITVVDSRSGSMGIGLAAIAAAKAAQSGQPVEDVVAAAEMAADEMHVYFVVDTLEFLKRNGRIGKAQALMGTLLNIKPILTLSDGIVCPFEKVRGKAKALKRIRELVLGVLSENPDKKFRIGLTNADCLGEVEKFADSLRGEPGIAEIIIGPIGPTIGVHVGPGTIALLFCPIN